MECSISQSIQLFDLRFLLFSCWLCWIALNSTLLPPSAHHFWQNYSKVWNKKYELKKNIFHRKTAQRKLIYMMKCSSHTGFNVSTWTDVLNFFVGVDSMNITTNGLQVLCFCVSSMHLITCNLKHIEDKSDSVTASSNCKWRAFET